MCDIVNICILDMYTNITACVMLFIAFIVENARGLIGVKRTLKHNNLYIYIYIYFSKIIDHFKFNLHTHQVFLNQIGPGQ